MMLRDYWWTAVGRHGDAVPVPFSVRLPLDKRGLVLRGSLAAGVVAGFCVLRLAMSPHWTQEDLIRTGGGILLFAPIVGLAACVLEFLSGAAMWPSMRRTMGEGLEDKADSWTLPELDGHIRDIRAQHAKAVGYTKLLHARHLAWLEARRDLRT